MTFVEYLAAAKDAVTIGAAFFAGYIAWQGLSTWRRQLKGNVQYELARRVLKATYKVRDGMQAFRDSYMSAGEIQQAVREAGEGIDEVHVDSPDAWKREGYVYSMRWKRVSDALSDLRLEATEAEVVWGKEFRDSLNFLYKCANELYSTLSIYLREKNEVRVREVPREGHFERMNKYEKIVWAGVDSPDEFGRKIEGAVAEIESRTKLHLKI